MSDESLLQNAHATPLFEVVDLEKRFSRSLDVIERLAVRLNLFREPAVVHAVDRVNLHIGASEIVALVGESGCGKSTLGRMIAGITAPSGGTMQFNGQPAYSPGKGRASATAPQRDDKNLRLKVQMIFQDPSSSMNPRRRIVDIVGEAARVHGFTSHTGYEGYVDRYLEMAGLGAAYRYRYPHQLSGGQRQRVGIARALAVQPDLLVCDESVAALDVSIQAQILNLFQDLRESLGLSYLFISHDLGVVRHIADRVYVMYLGRIVEQGTAKDIFANPAHPYTQALIEEAPRLHLSRKQFSTIKGEIPSPLQPPSGCHFHPRCPHAFARCRTEAPLLRDVGEPANGQRTACHLYDLDASQVSPPVDS